MRNTALEKTIADIWQGLLGVPRVGPDDNFFDLGGNSLLMIRVHRALGDALGIAVPIVDLFRCATVRSLAESLQTAGVAVISYQQKLPRKELNAFQPAIVPSSVDPFLERANKQRAACAQLRDRANGGSSS